MGLDLSLTGTGMVVLAKGKVRWRFLPTAPLHQLPKSAASQMHRGVFHGTSEERVGYIAYQIMAAWIRCRPSIVVIEEYAFSRGKSQAHALGELGGVVKHYLWVSEALWLPLTSTSNKLNATGNGQADKDEMIEKARKLWPSFPEFKGNDNVADAFHLARYGLRNFAKLVEAA